MRVDEVRSKYIEFFKARGHTEIPSAPLVPENDPTTLFTSSGMQPLVPYLLGQSHPSGKRIVDSQKAVRTGDIEEIGDNRHLTFFEMLGNWSLGDYFKQEQIPWVHEFFTKELGIPQEKLWVTCYEGDESLGIPRDEESATLWKGLGIPEEHIKFYKDKNWWSRAGAPAQMPVGEPGGPDSEVFYEFTHIEHDTKFGPECHPNCDCGHFVEIGNSVFMEYIKQADGSFAKLSQRNVDFGGGLERITAVTLNTDDVYVTDAFWPRIEKMQTATGKKYADDTKPFRIVADHTRAAEQLIADGVMPSNVERGYVVRRLIRRAVRYADMLGLKSLSEITDDQEIAKEEARFRETLARGMKEFEKGTDPFVLFTSYGFPIELARELAQEKGIAIDEAKFKEAMQQHSNLSRAGSEQKFKGGLADTAEKTVRLHTAHHLLLKALQTVLGPEVHQRGSNITQERLRIDFNYPQKVTKEQLEEIEKIVNEKIKEDLPVVRTEMSLEEAEKLHAEHEFGAKYPERVSVYSVGPLDHAFSIEFCGGPHVKHTAELSQSGIFKIQKEEASSAGIRRIKAVLE
ncbi:alanine--tRNA ligase [Candidatus Parcubacteria bacterium]|nr:alanine--tRNA ligase [Candidatus Parcubacteria bacterium]